MVINGEELFVVEYFPDSSLRLLYAPLRMTVFLVSVQTAEALSSADDSEEKEAALEYVRTKELLNIQHHHAELSKGMPDLSIAITRDCTLGCIYCHADAGVTGKSNSMQLEHVKLIAQYYFKQVARDFPGTKLVQVSFMGGGEPTVRPALLKYAVDQCRAEAAKIGVELVFTTAVNGFFGKQMADYLIAEFSSVSLSFDGPAFIQNVHRPVKNGRPSFDRVFATAKYFLERDFQFALRATISKLSLAHYQELVDFFATEFPGKQVGFEPLNPMGRGVSLDLAPSAEEFAVGIQEIAAYAASKDIVIGNASLGKFEQIKTVFCNAISAPGFTVTPEGEIWACTRENAPDIFRYGQFDFTAGKAVIDQAKLEKLKTINVFSFPECQDCFCKYHCAGDCPDNRYSNLLKCEATRHLGVQILNQLYVSGEPVSAA
ncbi:MAG: radical SAM protein [Patescibacteria group bacterium]